METVWYLFELITAEKHEFGYTNGQFEVSLVWGQLYKPKFLGECKSEISNVNLYFYFAISYKLAL